MDSLSNFTPVLLKNSIGNTSEKTNVFYPCESARDMIVLDDVTTYALSNGFYEALTEHTVVRVS